MFFSKMITLNHPSWSKQHLKHFQSFQNNKFTSSETCFSQFFHVYRTTLTFTNSFHFSCLVLIKIHNKIQSDIQQVLQITSCSQCLKTSKTFSYFSPSHVLPKQINDKMLRLTNKALLSTFQNYYTMSQIILELIRNQCQK